MAQIIGGEFQLNETNQNSMGGTERLTQTLAERLGKDVLADFQIVSSRVRELDEDKIRIFWAHDLPGDPESEFLKNKNKFSQFHLYVFVSNWQMQAYLQQYQIPWSKCVVLQNAIDPIEKHDKPDHNEQLNLIYHTTPHRGLNIAAAVFDKLAEKHKNLHLDVYSSFKIYGWEERDEPYSEVFKRIDNHPQATNHGTVPNSEIREALKKSHIFGYPCVWPETSCMSLMEAMSARNLCVHSNFAALPETSANWTNTYQFQEDQSQHASAFYSMMDGIITNYDSFVTRTESAASYANIFYGWEQRLNEWRALLAMLKDGIEDRSFPKPAFHYSTTPNV